MTELPYVILDVFTDTPLAGNPLAVFTDSGELDAATMQRLARELNLSETVFLGAISAGEPVACRIFTPQVELPVAGHPVLGAACVVGTHDPAQTVRLATGAGIIPVALRRAGGAVTGGEMEQPIPVWAPLERPQALCAALGVSTSPVEVYDNGVRHLYVALGSVAEVSALAPDVSALAAAIGSAGVSCFAVFGERVRTRMFGPGLGVVEDPATGSAAGPLAVHLARHGVIPYGTALVIDQGVEMGRPSRLEALAEGEGDAVRRVRVGGAAVPVAAGRFRLPLAGGPDASTLS